MYRSVGTESGTGLSGDLRTRHAEVCNVLMIHFVNQRRMMLLIIITIDSSPPTISYYKLLTYSSTTAQTSISIFISGNANLSTPINVQIGACSLKIFFVIPDIISAES